MECNFYVGQEVVCINDDPNIPPNTMYAVGGLDGLKKGQHYTVAEIFMHSLHDIPCIRVREIHREELQLLHNDKDQQGYFAFRFRPVKKTDISELEKILNTLKIKEPV